MTEKIELCYQAMRFTPIYGLLDLLLLFHFCLHWYFSAKRSGWKIDFWHAILFLGVFQSTLILYPFSASIYNIKSTLGLIEKISPFVDKAFLISALGYVCIWLGKYTYDMSRGQFPFIALCQLARPLYQLFEKNVKSKRSFLGLVFGAFCLGAIVLSVQFANGEFFNGRRFFLSSPEFRPFFNVVISIFPVAILFCSLRFVQFRERGAAAWLCILCAMALFFGVRSIVLGGVVGVLMLRAFVKQGRVSLRKCALVLMSLFLAAVILSHFREDSYDLMSSVASLCFNFFYGNNFSDTRDFAWILAFWDGEYLYGRSYLAAICSFIPRSLSAFREVWSVSMYTNALTGFSSDLMPGLRPGLFGESYLNFGLLGVSLFGWLFGFILRYVDVKIKECIFLSKDLIQGYCHVVIFSLISSLAMTAGIWAFYIFILIHFALVPLRGVKSRVAL